MSFFKKNKTLLIGLFLFLTLLIPILSFSLSQSEIKKEKTPTILFTLPFLAQHYENLISLELSSLLSVDRDPCHHVHLSAQDLVNLETAKWIIAVHPDHEYWLPKRFYEKTFFLMTEESSDYHFWVSPGKTYKVTQRLFEFLKKESLTQVSDANLFLEEELKWSQKYQELSNQPFTIATLHATLNQLKSTELPQITENSFDTGHQHHHESEFSPQALGRFIEKARKDSACLLGVGPTSSKKQELFEKEGLNLIGDLQVDHIKSLEEAWQNNFELLKQCHSHQHAHL